MVAIDHTTDIAMDTPVVQKGFLLSQTPFMVKMTLIDDMVGTNARMRMKCRNNRPNMYFLSDQDLKRKNEVTMVKNCPTNSTRIRYDKVGDMDPKESIRNLRANGIMFETSGEIIPDHQIFDPIVGGAGAYLSIK